MGKKTYLPPRRSSISVPNGCESFGEDKSSVNDFDFAKPRRGDEDEDMYDESTDWLVSSWSED